MFFYWFAFNVKPTWPIKYYTTKVDTNLLSTDWFAWLTNWQFINVCIRGKLSISKQASASGVQWNCHGQDLLKPRRDKMSVGCFLTVKDCLKPYYRSDKIFKLRWDKIVMDSQEMAIRRRRYPSWYKYTKKNKFNNLAIFCTKMMKIILEMTNQAKQCFISEVNYHISGIKLWSGMWMKSIWPSD